MKNLLWESKENIRSDLRQPDPACLADLKEATVGMRTETPAADGSYAEVITDLDRSSCYVNEALKPLPCGKVRPFSDESELLEGEWYIALCAIVILKDLPLGPFPLRASDGALSWPTKRGIYQNCWLTGGEVEDTRASACRVQVIRGWVWSDRRPFLRPWAEAILQAREQATSKEVADLVKMMGNFAIGRLALSGPRLVVRMATGATEPLVQDGLMTFYEAVPDLSNPTVCLPHVALCIWSEARREEYHYQLELIRKGKLVYLTNTDEIMVDGEVDDVPAGWRKQTLTNLVIVTNRGYVCDQRTVLPGHTAQARENAIEYAQRIVAEREWLRIEQPTEYYLRYTLPKERRKRADEMARERA